MTKKPWTPPEHRRLAEAIEKGLSATDIADDFQRSVHSLYQKAKELGLKFHGHKNPNRKLSEGTSTPCASCTPWARAGTTCKSATRSAGTI